jgi:hypothetical protein
MKMGMMLNALKSAINQTASLLAQKSASKFSPILFLLPALVACGGKDDNGYSEYLKRQCFSREVFYPPEKPAVDKHLYGLARVSFDLDENPLLTTAALTSPACLNISVSLKLNLSSKNVAILKDANTQKPSGCAGDVCGFDSEEYSFGVEIASDSTIIATGRSLVLADVDIVRATEPKRMEGVTREDITALKNLYWRDYRLVNPSYPK